MSDFAWTPDGVSKEQAKYNTLVSDFENGVEQRRQKWNSPIRTFELKFRARTQSEYAAVKAFFVLKEGELTSFTWTNPIDSTEYTVRFSTDEFDGNLIAFELYDFDITFIEVK